METFSDVKYHYGSNVAPLTYCGRIFKSEDKETEFKYVKSLKKIIGPNILIIFAILSIYIVNQYM